MNTTTTENTIIPRNLIEGANNNSFFNRGSGLERDAQNESNRFEGCEEIKRLEKRLGGFTDELAASLKPTRPHNIGGATMKRKVSLRYENFTGGWIGRCVKCGTVLASGCRECPKPLWSSCDCKE